MCLFLSLLALHKSFLLYSKLYENRYFICFIHHRVFFTKCGLNICLISEEKNEYCSCIFLFSTRVFERLGQKPFFELGLRTLEYHRLFILCDLVPQFFFFNGINRWFTLTGPTGYKASQNEKFFYNHNGDSFTLRQLSISLCLKILIKRRKYGI